MEQKLSTSASSDSSSGSKKVPSVVKVRFLDKMQLKACKLYGFLCSQRPKRFMLRYLKMMKPFLVLILQKSKDKHGTFITLAVILTTCFIFILHMKVKA